MLRLDSTTLPSVDLLRLESVFFQGVYTAIRTLDSPDEEYSYKFATSDDARFYAEFLHYLISIFNCSKWQRPSDSDIRSAMLLMEYFSEYLKSEPHELIDLVKQHYPQHPNSTPSWADICAIRVHDDDSGNLILNPRYVHRVSRTQGLVKIKVNGAYSDPSLEFHSTLDAERVRAYIESRIQIYNASQPPTLNQVIAHRSAQKDLRKYLPPKDTLLRVIVLLKRGHRAKKVEDGPLLIPLHMNDF